MKYFYNKIKISNDFIKAEYHEEAGVIPEIKIKDIFYSIVSMLPKL